MSRTSTSVTLRPAAAEDCPSLATLSIEVWLTTYLREGISRAFADYVLEHYTPDRFAEALSSAGECLLVSQNGGGIDGYIRLAHNRPSPAGGASRTEISTLYVRPCAQGTHIGASLLRAGLKAGASRDWDAPWLAANSENQRAIAFYLRHGFERSGLTWFQLQDGRYPNDVLQYRGAWQTAKT